MASFDIMPAVSEHGGHSRIVGLPVGGSTSLATADTSWQIGEVCTIDEAAGDVNVSADGALDPTTLTAVLVLAAGSSQGEIIKAAGLAGTTGDADGNLAPFYTFEPGVEYQTRNVFNNSDTNIGPGGSGAMTGVLVGVTADLWRDNAGTVGTNTANGNFGIDINGNYFTITGIFDALGRPTSVSGGTADHVKFMRVNN